MLEAFARASGPILFRGEDLIMTNHPNRSKKAIVEETVISVKGFDKNLKCREFQFELGKAYEHSGDVKVCASGFHACENPLDVFQYYPPSQSRFAVVEQSGKLVRHDRDTKIASAKITIQAELHLSELIQRAIKWVFDRSTPEKGASATGDSGAASATGTRGAASATGIRGAASATGIRGAASATGTRGAASATGIRGAASATGDSGAASATGWGGAASATGIRGAASATGWGGAASATGDSGAASATGIRGAASATGRDGRVMVAEGNVICLVYRDDNWKAIHAWAGIAGHNGIKPNIWYTLSSDGQPIECAD